ncbi:hypothetical protein JCM10450v2_008181 [Rhodotorula kratochvilovae]
MAADKPLAVPAPAAPSLASKLSTIAGILGAALHAAFFHLTVGPPAPTWPLLLSVLTAVIRWRSVSLVRARRSNPPSSPEEVVLLAKEQRDSTEKLLAVDKDKVQDGIVHELEILVKKRGVQGVLAELDGEETGARKLRAEWLAHVDLVKAPQTARSDKVILAIHGGAHVRLSPRTHRGLHVLLSEATKCRVFAIDYRLSPEVRYPASLLDAVNAYFYLTEELRIPAHQIIVEGDSAGGNLALALMMYLRDTKLPQVGGAILVSPWSDLSTSFASWNENKPHDYLVIDNHADPLHPPRLYLSSSIPALEASLHVGQLASPYISPALAPLSSLPNLPPMLVQNGALECLRDEITVLVRRLRAAGNATTHQMWSDGVHVFHALQPVPGASAAREAGAWVERALPRASAQEAGAWAGKVDALLRAERDARLARAGPIPPRKPVSAKWAYARRVERLAPVRVKAEGLEEARTAAREADEVKGEAGETEVFSPKRARRGWFA